MTAKKLSVCIITKNEEVNIARCLQSVQFADQIIVCDSHSTDNTVEICKQYTKEVFISDWVGFGQQREKTFARATGEWILVIDADEEVSEELQQEIKKIINNENKTPGAANKEVEYSGYEIPFQSHYCGHAIKFGDWLGEKHLRLVKRDKAKIMAYLVHCRIEVEGKTGKLKNKIIHYSFPTLDLVLQKMSLYSEYGAKKKYQAGEKACLFRAITHGLFSFIRGYILKLGFLDGKYGFMLAVSQAEGSYYKYLKLSMMKNNNSIDKL